MNMAEISVKRPVLITCLFLTILSLGILARTRLGTALYPDVSFPIVNVVVPFPGAGPEEIESQIAKPLETALNSLSGIRLVRSLSLDGAASVTAVFTLNTDIRFAEQKVIQTVARVRANFPSGIMEPNVRSINPSDTPVVTLSLGADLGESALFDLADRELRPLLEQVDEVGQVEIEGARKREIQVGLDINALRAHEMSAEEVVGRLGAAGMNIPVGETQNQKSETLIRSIGRFESLDAILKTPIRFVGNEESTSLGDVASVTDGLSDEKSRVYVNGKRALTLSVYKRSDANTVNVSNNVLEQVREISQDLGSKYRGFQLKVLRDGAKPVRDGIKDATDAILLGILLTVAVVLLFLGSLRSTFITGLAIPNSLLGAFFFMWFAGFSVNITTLAALALAVGLLIDDAIVVRENIFRHIEAGEAAPVAAVRGTNEVALAVIATTLTVLSVFGPLSFLQGIIGQFFKEFGLTICFAMGVSLLDSLTIAPMLSAYIRGDKAGVHDDDRGRNTNPLLRRLLTPFQRFQNSQQTLYLRILRRSLKMPLTVLWVAGAVFGLSFVVLMDLPKSFVPAQESGEFRVAMDLPADASLDATDELAQKADALIKEHPSVDRTVVTVGSSIGEKNHAEILVLLKPYGIRKESTRFVKEDVRKDLAKFPQANSRVEDLLDIGGGAGQPFVVNVTGEDMNELKQVTALLVERLKQNPDLKDVDRSYRPGAGELRWVFGPEQAKDFGISSAEAGHELRLLVSGEAPAHFQENGQDYDVRVRLKPGQVDFAKNPSRILIPNLNHRMIPIELVAQSMRVESPARIQRQNHKRFIEVSADINPSGHGLYSAIQETKRLFDSGELKHSAGVQYEFAGETKDFQDLLKSVLLAVGLSVGAMYLVLASLYESFFVPLAIMLVLPLAICGAFYGLWLTHSSLDIYSMIGCVLLLGVAAKNSILLVDYIQHEIRKGRPLQEAILDAGRMRLRPILMTSFALIAGMLPMALPLQESSRQRAPMAIAVISGVVTSTMLTLVVIPAAYAYVLSFQNWTLKKLSKFIRSNP